MKFRPKAHWNLFQIISRCHLVPTEVQGGYSYGFTRRFTIVEKVYDVTSIGALVPDCGVPHTCTITR